MRKFFWEDGSEFIFQCSNTNIVQHSGIRISLITFDEKMLALQTDQQLARIAWRLKNQTYTRTKTTHVIQTIVL